MKYQLAYAYQNTKKNINDFNFVFSFIDGAKLTITGNSEQSFNVKFIDLDSSEVVYETVLKTNMWAAPAAKYFVNWSIQIFKEGNLIKRQDLSLDGKQVKIIFDTGSIGDSLAYIESAEDFRKKHNCSLTCVVFNKDMYKLLKEKYTSIAFCNLDKQDDFYAIYRIQYPIKNWQGIIKKDPRTISLTDVAPLTLGLELRERRPSLGEKKTSDKKYVCIATQSTSQCKYWNNKKGWEEVVKYLNDAGYEVWCIDRHSSFGSAGNFNRIPKGAIDKTGEFSLATRIDQICGAEFFIGLGSGLSWLAWACNVPVVLVSGFSKPFAEFYTPYRVINESVCNGCWNDPSLAFDKGDWNWCPRNKDFECTKQITSQDVIKQINKIISTRP